MVQRTGEQAAGTVTFVKNKFYHDAFFIKAQGRYCSLRPVKMLMAVLNGACDGECQAENGKAYSVSYVEM
jgi:hypothetical protein